MARPSKFTKRLVQEICDRRAEGQTLIEIAADPNMPSVRTVQRWARDRDDFGSVYYQAGKQRAALLIEKSLEAVRHINDRDEAACARVQVDTYLKVASRTDPENWNEAVLVRHGGVKGDAIEVNDLYL